MVRRELSVFALLYKRCCMGGNYGGQLNSYEAALETATNTGNGIIEGHIANLLG